MSYENVKEILNQLFTENDINFYLCESCNTLFTSQENIDDANFSICSNQKCSNHNIIYLGNTLEESHARLKEYLESGNEKLIITSIEGNMAQFELE